MSNAPALHNQHRRNWAIAWEQTVHVATMTPTADDEVAYQGTVKVYSPGGVELASVAFDYTSDADGTAEEIVTGILADLTASAVDTYAALSGTDTVIITCDSPGYRIVVLSTGAGTIATAYTGAASSMGTTPANASEWVAEGARFYVLEADPSFILGDAAVPNEDLQPRVFQKQRPHKSLPTADGGSVTMRLSSTGGAYSAGAQQPATGLGRLLEHAIGASTRSNHTAIGTVTNQTTFIVSTATYLAIGQMIAFEDADNAGALYPAQIVNLSGSTITIDREMPFTVTTSDKIYAAESVYPEQAALTNPQDSNFSTLSILYQMGPHCWMAGGAHLSFDTITVERGMQPKLGFGVLAGQGYPQGDGAPSEPTWTDTIQGAADVAAIGYGTKCFLQTFGTATNAEYALVSAAITVGVPVLPQDGVTQVDTGMPGRFGYRTEPANTEVEIVVAMTDAEQTRWTAGSYVVFTYYQVAAVGYGWCFHIPKGTVMEPPVLVAEGTNKWRMKILALENPDGTTEAEKAKFHLARY